MKRKVKTEPTPAEVVGLGQCSLDYMGKIEDYPRPDMKCEFREMTVQGGGPAATALVALSRWGVRCAFCGITGDDDFGSRIRESLTTEGIGTDGIVVREGCVSQFAFIAVEPESGGRRTIFWQRPTGGALRPCEVDSGVIRRARVFHTDGLMVEASLAAAKVAKDAGATVVVDGGTLREGMIELARLSDCFIVSQAFATALVPGGTPTEACRLLAALGPSVVAVTLGSRGYVALSAEGVIEKPAYPVRAVDTTGCGDVFHAGFVYGLLAGWGVAKCLDFGAWAASRVSLRLGGRAGIPTHSEMEVNGYGGGLSVR